MNASKSRALSPPIREPKPKQSPSARQETARRLFARLSPGSRFDVSECGRHVAMEWVAIALDDRLGFVPIAYYTNDSGCQSDALICGLCYRQPVPLHPLDIKDWQNAVRSSHYFPKALIPALPIMVTATREWVLNHAKRGWPPVKASQSADCSGAA